jgi:hypothetical protein
MNEDRSHSELLNDLYGSDIGLYPSHLATLNLAAREINDEANYPRIARTDFFDVLPGKAFCELPIGRGRTPVPIMLPILDSVVGNPPYVRQEKISKKDKIKYGKRVEDAFPGFKLRGRADLHCYFWPHATRFLKELGYFGFLTSGQWLDVDYGFALQGWILSNFRIVAIMESSTERWFPDARVKTCITILQRCSDLEERNSNLVRFVRFEKPLSEIIGRLPTGGVGKDAEVEEDLRQSAVDKLRDQIEKINAPVHDEKWRVMIKPQQELWNDGVSAKAILKSPVLLESSDDENDDDDEQEAPSWLSNNVVPGDYLAGKWGRYLRAPDLYFEIMSRFRESFIPLGKLTKIRFGVKTGCDDFFMPQDVTVVALRKAETDKEFRKLIGISRDKVEKGEIKIIEDGAGTWHAIESEFLKPEVHSLMKVDRPEIRARDVDRVVLMVSDSLTSLRGTHVYKYLKHGEVSTYASKKSKAVPVPQRSTCAARDPWYDLTGLVDPGFALWPMAQQYRHIIPGNPERLICNHNLFDLSASDMTKQEQHVLLAILNSTLIGLFKTFYGRFAGTEGNLKTEVIDVNLIDVPDPRGVNEEVATRLIEALKSMTKRDVGRMVDESFMDCHSYPRALELASRPLALSEELRQPDRRQLDDAVFEVLGVARAAERKSLVDRLYSETASHFRSIRVTEIQKLEDRAKGETTRFSASEQAADAWDAIDLPDLMPLAEWLRIHASGATHEISIPDERPVGLTSGSMFDYETVYFGKKRQNHVVCPSRGTAQLIARIATLGVTGPQLVPSGDDVALSLLDRIDKRHEQSIMRFKQLVESRTPDAETQGEVLNVLERWFVLGRTPVKQKAK